MQKSIPNLPFGVFARIIFYAQNSKMKLRNFINFFAWLLLSVLHKKVSEKGVWGGPHTAKKRTSIKVLVHFIKYPWLRIAPFCSIKSATECCAFSTGTGIAKLREPVCAKIFKKFSLRYSGKKR
jgi:hypothetical protein